MNVPAFLQKERNPPSHSAVLLASCMHQLTHQGPEGTNVCAMKCSAGGFVLIAWHYFGPGRVRVQHASSALAGAVAGCGLVICGTRGLRQLTTNEKKGGAHGSRN